MQRGVEAWTPIVNKWGCEEGEEKMARYVSVPTLLGGEPHLGARWRRMRWLGSRWERVSNTGGSPREESGWFALQRVRPDASAGDRYIYSLQRLSSPAVPRLPLKAIHPRTWIRNEIISLPPRALITQPWWLDGPRSPKRGQETDWEKKELRWGAARVQ